MEICKSALAVVFSGAMLVAVTTPAWSQEAPGERRQPDQNLTRPGTNESVPGMRGQGTIELSKDDMLRVEEALKSKGYNPGPVDGVVDDTNRAAIRSFQKDNNIPITGTIDKRTAERLGVTVDQKQNHDRGINENRPRSDAR